MLALHEAWRLELVAKRALTVNDKGDEVLVGLTLAESYFYLAYEEPPREAHSSAETNLYFQLKHKHLVARIQAFENGSTK